MAAVEFPVGDRYLHAIHLQAIDRARLVDGTSRQRLGGSASERRGEKQENNGFHERTENEVDAGLWLSLYICAINVKRLKETQNQNRTPFAME